MAVWRFVNLDIPEAQFLADLTGVEEDLKATAEICDLLLGEFAKGPSNLSLLEALTSAALVRYARPFLSGVRTRIPASVFDGLSQQQRADHQWFKELRDKYIAHSVNAFEENQVVAYLFPEERESRGVSNIEVQQTRLASLGTEDVQRLKALSLDLQRWVEQLIKAEKQKVLAIARSLPVDALYHKVDPPARAATRADAGKSRKR